MSSRSKTEVGDTRNKFVSRQNFADALLQRVQIRFFAVWDVSNGRTHRTLRRHLSGGKGQEPMHVVARSGFQEQKRHQESVQGEI